MQHNEIQIEFLLLPYRSDKSPESFPWRERRGETWDDIGRGFVDPAVTKKPRTRDFTFVQQSWCPSLFWSTERERKACVTLLYVVFNALFHFLMPLICLASPETSNLATWMGMTTLTASLWGECLASSLPLSSHVILLFLYLTLPAVSYLTRLELTCNASLCHERRSLVEKSATQTDCHFFF